jgi:hypothetical protein
MFRGIKLPPTMNEKIAKLIYMLEDQFSSDGIADDDEFCFLDQQNEFNFAENLKEACKSEYFK